MKNDFRQLVDRNLSGLQWDAARRERVLRSLEPEGGTTMKRKLTMALALAAALVMMASVAVAAVVLHYSPAASALNKARNAVVEKYGLTHTTLGLFNHELYLMENETVVVFHSDVVDEYGAGLTGEYTVTIPDEGDISASWTFDNVDASVWQTGDMDAPVWGQPQLETFLRDKTEGGTVNDNAVKDDGIVAYVVMNTPQPPSAEIELVDVTITEVVPGEDDLAQDEAIALAAAALMDTFGLSEDQVARVDFFSCELTQISPYATKLWHINGWLKVDGYDWNMYVVIDAATGEITDIGMTTGGNG